MLKSILVGCAVTILALTAGSASALPTATSPYNSDKIVDQYGSAFSEFYRNSTEYVNINICTSGKPTGTRRVTKPFAESLAQLGSGRWNGQEWYTVVEGKSATKPYGCYARTGSAIGQTGNVLFPYASAASADFNLGDHVYVKDLDGMPVNAVQKHNGCLVIEGQFTNPNSVAIYIFSAENRYFFEKFNQQSTHRVEKKDCKPITDYAFALTDPSHHI
ncbi:hypothetical protein BJ085DRAFT_39427 [Dimargaris cristalligena]|uniref:Uncharacterized protein n=1 Tax=Dimargaris cristalligena TaxID=215637 RepID=A0A4Q0A1U1_9FUNG|nr:hypothetical protein BJ085DRAFT_39427 [Dimargaris cristalligena]|eukprot:RKP39130.1 hypothetical protein BJ085DRAFT_39427 [Dimargaris cristalligena]